MHRFDQVCSRSSVISVVGEHKYFRVFLYTEEQPCITRLTTCGDSSLNNVARTVTAFDR